MKTILVICPSSRDKRELTFIARKKNYHLIFDSFSSEWLEYCIRQEKSDRVCIKSEIRNLINRYKNIEINAIISSDDYPGSALAAIMASERGLPGPSVEVVLYLQHKYYSRKIQEQFAPYAVPEYQLLNELSLSSLALTYPFFIKPVKSYFSINAGKVCNGQELWQRVQNGTNSVQFLEPFHYLLKEYTSCEWSASYCIAESLLEGEQVTLDGYIFQGNYYLLGIVQSVMYPHTISFQRFEYPVHDIPEEIVRTMNCAAKDIMIGSGFDNGLFNIEFMYNRETKDVFIIEINPRMSSQFADLYERVNGTNSYEILIDIALGNKPSLRSSDATFNFAASCVLRTFRDAITMQVPTVDQLQAVNALYPDARIEICTSAGKKLSEELQDDASFRYAVINLGGHHKEDLLQRLNHCSLLLKFQFEYF